LANKEYKARIKGKDKLLAVDGRTFIWGLYMPKDRSTSKLSEICDL